MTQIFDKAVTYKGERCDVEYVSVNSFDRIPDACVEKAHAVCFHNGKLLLVNHSSWNVWGVPGGSREDGETIIQTLTREILEETNCTVVQSFPLGYIRVIHPTEDDVYRLQFVCFVEPTGEFEEDPAGGIDKILWIDPAEFEAYIENKEFKKVIVRDAIDQYSRRGVS